MDHTSSIITQVTKDEGENATSREEGEFGKSLSEVFSTLRMTMSEGQETAVFMGRHAVSNVTRGSLDEL